MTDDKVHMQHSVISSIALLQFKACLHAAEKHSSRRKLLGGKLQKSGSRAQTLVSYLEGVTSWGEMIHLQLQKQGITCLRRPCHFCISRLLQISWAEQKLCTDTRCFPHWWCFACAVLLLMVADYFHDLTACLLLICMSCPVRHIVAKLVWTFWVLYLALCIMCLLLSQPSGQPS